MPDAFLIRAAVAGLGIAVAAAPLGCFVLWRRMAYFGDATAHAAILGVALALVFDIAVLAGVLTVALLMGLALTRIVAGGGTADATLGVFAHGGLALGLVAISLTGGYGVDLDAFLFGDILAVNWTDVAIIWIGSLIVLALICWRWTALLTTTLNADLAAAAGLKPARESLILTVTVALMVAISLKIVGALMIGALLIIPPATARAFAVTPERMALIAGLCGSISVLAGLGMSYQIDTPAGPSIVAVAVALYAAAMLKTLIHPALR